MAASPPPTVYIEIFFGLADETMKLELDLQSTTVYSLKCLTSERWRVPTACQQMVLGNQVLPDSETLAKHCQHGITGISLVMVESYDGLFDSLSSRDGDARWNAVGVLTKVAFKDVERALRALYLRLQPNYECEARVRVAAIDALVYVVSTEKANRETAMREKELEEERKKAEKKKKGKSADADSDPEEDEEDEGKRSDDEEEDVLRPLIDALLGRFVDFEASVRDAALQALLGIVAEGDAAGYVRAALRIYLQHDQSFVRNIALRALDELVEDGDEDTIPVVCKCLGDASSEVRDVAFKVLSRIVPRDHVETKAALGKHMESDSFPVRVSAVRLLAVLVSPGDEEVVVWLCKSLGAYKEEEIVYSEPSEHGSDSDTPSEKEGKAVIKTRVTGGDWKPDVRAAAMDALAVFGEPGHDLTDIAVRSRLRDSDWQVRRAVLSCKLSWVLRMPTELPELEGAEDAKAKAKAGSKGRGKGKGKDEPEDSPERVAARQLLLDARGERLDGVRALALTYLEDESSEMRRAAIEILIRMAPAGDPEIVDAVLACLAVTEIGDMKWLAMKTLVRLAEPTDRRVGAALVKCIEGEDGELKASAVEAVASFITDVAESPEDEGAKAEEAKQQLAAGAKGLGKGKGKAELEAQGDGGSDREDGVEGVSGDEEEEDEEEEEEEEVVPAPTYAEFMDRLIATLTACLEDQRAVVRLASLLVLPLVIPKGDARAEAAITERLKDRDKKVQAAARKALA